MSSAVVLTSVIGDHLAPVEEMFEQIAAYTELFGVDTVRAIIGGYSLNSYEEIANALRRLEAAHSERLKIQALKRTGEVR